MNNPFLSIVIANYNYGRFLTDAIESVILQCEEPEIVNGHKILPVKGCNGYGVELIICDAESTDNSVDVIKEYEQYLSWWCSEPDGGQSAAFNKGFRQSCGDWLTWLNSDELYADGMLFALFKLMKRKKTAMWITGNYVNFNDSNKIITHVTWGPHTSPSFLSNQHYPSAVFGSTSFWKREVYEIVGLIDERLRYAMDTDYWARLVMAGYRQTRLNHYCWLFRDHDGSKTVGVQTDDTIEKRKQENKYHLEKNGYHYKFSFKNPWYVFWLIWRFFDGSIFVRWYRKKSLVGQHISVLSEVMK
jgi:glycosyltransferase involved in cell wall biosynthesis